MLTFIHYAIVIVTAQVVLASPSAPRNDGLMKEPWLAVFVEPQKTIPKEGGSVDLLCSAEATPVAVIHWLLNGKRIRGGIHEDENNFVEHITNDGSPTLQESITHSRLRIPCVNKNTVGRYQCVANNGMLTKSANTTIELSEKTSNDVQVGCAQKRSELSFAAVPAEVYMWTDSRLERSGVTVQLMCRARGNPQPKIRWFEYKSNPNKPMAETELALLTESENHIILSNGDLLTKTPLNPVEGGTVFKCVASNPWGEDSVNVLLDWPSMSDM